MTTQNPFSTPYSYLVTVTTAEIDLIARDLDYDPAQVFIRNTDATNSVFLGGEGVTTANGFPLIAATTIGPFNFRANESLKAISAGSVVVAVLIMVRG